MDIDLFYIYRMDYDIIIIGGGASGLMLAANLNLNNKHGIILEKNSKIGTKLLLSGGGRCNITHGGSIKDFVSAYGESGRFLRKALYKHSNLELMKFLEGEGLSLIDENGRIFPSSMKSSDILDVFVRRAKSNGWVIRTGSEVCGISMIENSSNVKRDANESSDSDGRITSGVMVDINGAKGHETLAASSVVIASGGITMPEVGTDGKVLRIVGDLGVNITNLKPALAPVAVHDYPYAELSGISVPDVTVTAFSSDTITTCKGKAARMTGDLLFTHNGFSGPVVLNISRYAERGERIRISYNKTLDELPKRLVKVLEDRSRGPSGDIKTSRLAALLDNDDFTVSGIGRNGMVTAGGISLDEIDSSTMRVKKISSPDDAPIKYAIYAIGEAIDADGITGGYNLQMCWSTACTAADSLRDKL